jgi:hypothetical protein
MMTDWLLGDRLSGCIVDLRHENLFSHRVHGLHRSIWRAGDC